MIAWVNGIQVIGTPEEIERYRQLATEKKSVKNLFNIVDDIPEHVKNYRKHNKTYKTTVQNKMRAWF